MFVDRDPETGRISRCFGVRQRGDQEEIADDAPELLMRAAVVLKLAAIADRLVDETALGVEWNGKRFQIDDRGERRISAQAIYARACLDGDEVWEEGADDGWIATDNSRPAFTAQEFWDFAKVARVRVRALTLHARSLKDAVLAAAAAEGAEAADVLAIDVATGWD